jgi:hypothetical protein
MPELRDCAEAGATKEGIGITAQLARGFSCCDKLPP